MTTQERIDTLRLTIATLTRFIAAPATPQNARENATKTRDDLRCELNRMTDMIAND